MFHVPGSYFVQDPGSQIQRHVLLAVNGWQFSSFVFEYVNSLLCKSIYRTISNSQNRSQFRLMTLPHKTLLSSMHFWDISRCYQLILDSSGRYTCQWFQVVTPVFPRKFCPSIPKMGTSQNEQTPHQSSEHDYHRKNYIDLLWPKQLNVEPYKHFAQNI